jgi:hypothetical protein
MDYCTQVEAERDIRAFYWGDVTFARRQIVYPPKPWPRMEPAVVVVAQVDARLVVFRLDNYGRRSRKPEILPR